MRINYKDILNFMIIPSVCLMVITAAYSLAIRSNLEKSAASSLTRIFNDNDVLLSLSLKNGKDFVVNWQKTTQPKVKQNYATWLKSPVAKNTSNKPMKTPVLKNSKSQQNDNIDLKPRVNESLFQDKK